MSDNLKPCRWVVSIRNGWCGCGHPLMAYHEHGRNERTRDILCDGCPCREPQPDLTPTGCQWDQDWEGNWDASCGLCWCGDDIGGMNFCPNCGLPVTAVPYEAEIVCPGCGGPADNGFDRCVPPSPYYCTKCNEPPKDTNEL